MSSTGTRPPVVGQAGLPAGAAVGTVLVLALAAVHLLAPGAVLRDASYLLVLVGSVVVAAVGTRSRTDPTERRTARLVTLGLVAMVGADVALRAPVWLGVEPVLPLVAAAFGVTYVCVARALLLARRATGGARLDVGAVLDASTVMVVTGLVLWVLTLEGLFESPDLPRGYALVWIAGLVFQSMLLTVTLRVLGSRCTRPLLGWPFVAGVACWTAATVVALLTLELTAPSDPVDVGWMLGAALVAASTQGWSAQGAPAASLSQPTAVLVRRVLVANLPLAVPPLVQAGHDPVGSGPSRWVPLLAMAVLLALSIARTTRLLLSEAAARASVDRSQRHYERLASNSSDAVAVVDADGRIRGGAARLARLLGDGVDLAGRDPAECFAELVGVHPRDLVADAAPEADGVVGRELLLRHEGDERWFDARLVNMLDDSDVRGVVVSLSEVTARKRIEAELERARDAALEASRAKSAFLATMSHEIRTPMNGVIGLTGLLLGTDLDERQRQYAEGAHGAGEALLAIINDILDFSKIEAGKLELEEVDFDLLWLVEETAGLVTQTAQAKGLELAVHCAPDLPRGLRGDPTRVRQVLLNLVSNAVKFTEHGEVVVRASLAACRGDRTLVRFEVTDTGIGLPDDARRHLFQPFSQADSSTTRRFGGTGLGLAICHQLVTAMGGAIGVDSTPGVGSTFWFTVPVADALDAHTAVRPPPSEDRSLAGLRVLVVDDNRTNRVILGEQLAAWDVDVRTAADGVEALAAVAESRAAGRPFELAVLDLLMPGIDGVELARRLAADPTWDAPVVVLTSGPDVTAAQARDARIASRLTKPVLLVRLHEVLADVVQSARRRGTAAFPIDGAAGTTTLLDPTAARVERGVRGHLLVVEDNEVNQVVALGLLENLGFSAEVAADGRAALALVRRGGFDGVLMDCQMPVMDGYEATAAIRAGEVGSRLPVIAMTAGVVEGGRQRCLDAGMDDFVAKPVSPVELEAALSRWVTGPTDAAALSI